MQRDRLLPSLQQKRRHISAERAMNESSSINLERTKAAIVDFINNNPNEYDSESAGSQNGLMNFLPFAFGLGSKSDPYHTAIDKVIELNEFFRKAYEQGTRYDLKQCQENYHDEYSLCGEAYRGRMSDACMKRAADRLRNCRNLGHYNGVEIWTFEDATGQPRGKDNPDVRRANGKGIKGEPGSQPDDKPSEFNIEPQLLQSVRGLGYLFAPHLAPHPKISREWLKYFVLPKNVPSYGKAGLTPYAPPPWLLPALGMP